MRQTRSQAKIAKLNNGNNAQLQEIEELKVIISSFNNRELSHILGVEYNSKQSKTNLRSNVLKQLQSSFSTTQDKIRILQKNRKVSIEAPTTQMYHQDMNMVVSQQGNGTANHPNGTNNGVVVYNQQGALTHPNIKMKKLAFFEVMGVLLKPTTLHSAPTQRVQEGTYYFHLSPQQATDIASNRDIRNASKHEHLVQVQLRFCLLETSCEQDDFFPPNVIVKVNNKLCALPNPIPTNKPGVEAKRPPRPVNITPNVKLSPTTPNQISVSWCTEYTRGYVISVFLVKKLSSAQLLNGMKTLQKIQPSESTRALIKEKLNEDADCDIATTMLKVSLVCPLGKMRMTTPCRAATCSHMQCFDAFTYLQMNEKKPTWNCPVCDKPAPYESLVVDGYFQEVLSSPELSSDTNEIQLNKDGSWSTHVIGSDSQSLDTPCKKYQSVDISDDIEVIETKHITKIAAMASLNEPTSTTITTSALTIEHSVDLTQSDSDDDVPLKKNLPPPKQIIAVPAPVNATAASRTNEISEVSIISLDSPTPPSSPVNISSVYVDTPPSHMININSGVSSTTHNNWSNPAINSLSNNYNLLPSSPLLQDPLGGGLNEFYQRQILQNNSPNMFNSYSTADEDNRY